MAPRKPDPPLPTAKGTKESKKSQGGVVKRPARGFHRHKDGSLNIKPKGAEKKVFNTNQNSTFFRFPGEIRNKIYAYALGGYNLICSRYNADGTSRPHFVPLPFDTKPKARLGLNLLQVCRQIYLEAYLFPFQCNTFYFKDRQRQLTDRRLLRPYQRYAITKIDLAAFRWRGQGLHISSKLLSGTLRPHLPALKHVRIRILTPNLNEANLEGACESALLNLLGKEDPDGVEVSAVYAHKYEELA